MQSTQAFAPGLSRVEFTTRVFPDKEGFSFWQDEICRYLSPSLTERLEPGRAFAASLKRVVIGRAGVCDLSFSPMRNLRDARCLRQMPDDDVFVAVMKAGTGHLEQGGRTARLAAGDAVLYESARPFAWHFGQASRVLVARVPRRDMAARLPMADTLTARVIPAAHPSAALIDHAMGDVVRFDGDLGEGCVGRLGRTLIDLVASSVEACLVAPGRPVADDPILARAKAFLLENSEDPGLDLAAVTRHTGVSVRTLCRAFAAEGTTPIRWLWQQRLTLADRLLREGRVTHVGQVAMLCGFSDFSHFSRAFKKAHGVSPKALLKAPGPARPAPAP